MVAKSVLRIWIHFDDFKLIEPVLFYLVKVKYTPYVSKLTSISKVQRVKYQLNISCI